MDISFLNYYSHRVFNLKSRGCKYYLFIYLFILDYAFDMALSIDSMVKQACLFLAKKIYFHTSINKNIKKIWILFKKV